LPLKAEYAEFPSGFEYDRNSLNWLAE
jgi:hypothetical protein